MLFEADYAKNYASIMYQCLPSRVTTGTFCFVKIDLHALRTELLEEEPLLFGKKKIKRFASSGINGLSKSGEGRRRSWTGEEGCPLDPFDATDEPSGCSPSQAAIPRTMIVFNHQFGKFSQSRIHVVSTDVRHAPSESPAKRTLADGDRRERVRSAAAARCAWPVGMST